MADEETDRFTRKDIYMIVVPIIFSLLIPAIFGLISQNLNCTKLILIGSILALFIFFHIYYSISRNIKQKITGIIFGILVVSILVCLNIYQLQPESNQKVQALFHPIATTTPAAITPVITTTAIAVTENQIENVMLKNNCIPKGWNLVSLNGFEQSYNANSCLDTEKLGWGITASEKMLHFLPPATNNDVYHGLYVSIPRPSSTLSFSINITKLESNQTSSPFFFFGNFDSDNEKTINGKFAVYVYSTANGVNQVAFGFKDSLGPNVSMNEGFALEKNYLSQNTKIFIIPNEDKQHFSIQIGDEEAKGMFKDIPYSDNGMINLLFGYKNSKDSTIDVTVNIDLCEIYGNSVCN